MLSGKSHLNVNVDTKNAKKFNWSFRYASEPESSDCCSLKVAGSQPEARWDDMFVYALLAV